MQLVKAFAMICVLAVVTTAAANANTRSVTTTGTAPVGGLVHITIEDFGKPGRHDPIGPLSLPASIFDVYATILPGWNCAQTTVAMRDAMVAALPPVYLVMIAPTNPCILYISREQQGNVAWNLNIEIEVEGLTVLVEEGAVPLVPTTWSFIKSPGFNRFR